MPAPAILLTTADYDVARRAGFNYACDPRSDGEGFTISGHLHPQVGPCAVLNGPDGEVELIGAEAIRMVSLTLAGLLIVSKG